MMASGTVMTACSARQSRMEKARPVSAAYPVAHTNIHSDVTHTRHSFPTNSTAAAETRDRWG